MTNNEFLRIKTDEILIRTEEWLKGYERISQQIATLRSQFPSQMTTGSIVIDVDLFERREDQTLERKRRAVAQRIAELEQREIPRLYQHITSKSNIYLAEHHRQQQSFSCTLASSLNALEALDQRGDLSEQDLARAIEESGAENPIVLQKSLAFLTSRGLKVNHVSSTLDLVKRLEEDQVVLLTDYSRGVAHEILLSGVDIEQGQINLRINDPLEKTVRTVSIQEMVGRIEYEIPNAYAVSAPEEGREHEEIKIVLIDE